MPAASVKRPLWRRQVGISERAHGDPDGLIVTMLGVEHGRSASGTKAEREACPLISDAHVLRGSAEDLVWRREARKCRKDAARPALTCEAMANPDASGFTFPLNAQLNAAT